LLQNKNYTKGFNSSQTGSANVSLRISNIVWYNTKGPRRSKRDKQYVRDKREDQVPQESLHEATLSMPFNGGIDCRQGETMLSFGNDGYTVLSQ
jgi:hypothetical protein